MEEKKKVNDYPVMTWGWFYFLIYFSLWAGAILNIVNGIRQLTGNIYLSEGLKPAIVYGEFPALKDLDVLFGLFTCALGVFQIITRFALAHYKTYAPTMLHLSYVFGMIINMLSSIALFPITGGSSFLTLIVSIIINIIFLSINIKYFNNRKYVFVN